MINIAFALYRKRLYSEKEVHSNELTGFENFNTGKTTQDILSDDRYRELLIRVKGVHFPKWLLTSEHFKKMSSFIKEVSVSPMLFAR